MLDSSLEMAVKMYLSQMLAVEFDSKLVVAVLVVAGLVDSMLIEVVELGSKQVVAAVMKLQLEPVRNKVVFH